VPRAALDDPPQTTSGIACPSNSDSPYVGPRPFQAADGERFFGRDREAVDLKHRVMAHPITLLYSMSGAGKTSLINARLAPELKSEGCRVLPSARVRGSSWKLDPSQIVNIYVFNALMSWQGHYDSQTTARLTERTFKDELAPAGKDAEDTDSLLIVVFDQFEELFSAYSSRWRDRRGFFEQLADALESIPNLRALLAMREDYVASLDPYARLVHEGLRTRFRLERLRREAALEAVVKPTVGTGRRFASGVAERLIDNLMTIQVSPRDNGAHAPCDNVDSDLLTGAAALPSPSGEIPVFKLDSGDYVATAEYVEPVQLQVVCHNLWTNLRPDEIEITAAHLESCGDVNQALGRFYDECVVETAEATGLREGVIRRWFGERLITPAGTRGLALRGPQTTAELPNSAVDLLEGHFLIRGEDRGGARWYELSHDRFIEPVRSSNRRWQSARPGQALWIELNQRAAEWESAPEAEKPALLLKKTELARAEAWKASADASELGINEPLKQLLDESRDAIEKAELAAQIEAERKAASDKARRNVLLMRVVSGLVAIVLLAIAGWVTAIFQTRIAQVSEHGAQISRLAMQAQADMQTNPRFALGEIQSAIDLVHETGVIPEHRTEDVLRNSLAELNHRSTLGTYSKPANQVAFAPRSWGAVLRKGPSPILAVAGQDGQVDLWDLHNYDDPNDDERVVPSIKPPPGDAAGSGRRINRIVFDPTGSKLVFCTGDTTSVIPEDCGGSAWMWIAPSTPSGASELRPLVTSQDTGPIADIAFSRVGKTIASAGCQPLAAAKATGPSRVWQGDIRVFDGETGHLLRQFTLVGPGRSVAFDSTGLRLVAASGDTNGVDPSLPGEVRVFKLNPESAQEKEGTPMKGYAHPSIRALFSLDGKAVVSGGVDGIGRVHDAETGELFATLTGHQQKILDLNFSPDGTRLVTASGDRTARIWNPPSWSARPTTGTPAAWSSEVTLVGHKDSVGSAEFNLDGSLVLTGSYDGTARVWDAQTGECLVVHRGHAGRINAARFFTRGFLMATAGVDRPAEVWTTGNVETPRLLLAAHGATAEATSGLHGHDAALRALAFRPGKVGRYEVLTAGADGVTCLWDVRHWEKPTIVQHPLRRFEPAGPTAPITDAAFSPDGELAATAAVDGVVRLWSVEGGIQLGAIEAETGRKAGAALGVAFSPSGTYLLTSWADAHMRLYRRDGNDWKPVAGPWPGSAFRLAPQLFDLAERFVVTPNAGVLAVGGATGWVRVWDTAAKTESDGSYELRAPVGNLGPVADLAVNPKTGEIVAATMGPAGAVIVWGPEPTRSLPRGRVLIRLCGAERLAFNPAGTLLAVEEEDGLGRTWSWPLGDGKSHFTPLPGLTGPSPALAFSNDGDYLATDVCTGIAQVWDVSGKPLARAIGRRDRLMAVAFSSGPKLDLLSINREGRFQKWSIPGGEPLESARGPYPVPSAVAISRDGDLAVSGTHDGNLKVWSTKSGAVIARSDPGADSGARQASISSVAFSADGRSIVAGDIGGVTTVWILPDPAKLKNESSRSAALSLSRRAIFSAKAKPAPINAVRFLDNNSRFVAIGAGDLSRARLQDPSLTRPESEHKTNEFDAFAFKLDLSKPQLPAEKVVVATDLTRGSLAAYYPVGALTAAVSPADGRIFVGYGGQEVTSNCVLSGPPYQRQSGSERYVGHSEAVLDLAVSSDGKWLATASADNTARVWTIPQGQSPNSVELRGHSGDVSFVTFSPKDEFILTLSRQDGTALIWDRDGGSPTYVLGTGRAGFNSARLNDPPGPRQYTADVVAAAFSHDGKLVVTAHGDGSARVYRVELCGGLDDLKQVAERRLNGFSD